MPEVVFVCLGSGPFARAKRFLVEAGGYGGVTLREEFYSEAENGAYGRTRSTAESAAIRARYSASDAWRSKSAAEKMTALRKARRAIAARTYGGAESEVSLWAIAKELGIRPKDIQNGFWWQLAGDFVPRRPK